MSDDLKPCPFCGEAQPPHDDTSWVRCLGCGAETGWRPTGDEAIAAWNTRTPDTSIEALTKQLEAARADAKEAEAYAEGLEREVKTCCMAQVVMDNTVAELERERDDYAFKLDDANNTYSEMHVALSEANDKLVKAVEALTFYADFHENPNDGPWGVSSQDFGKHARATLAEIESSTPYGLEGEKV
jgi:Lar family restriction alleviation protein